MTAAQTTGARLVEMYDNDRAQALEVAHTLGGEAERLLLAMDRAGWICAEIEDYAERRWGASWELLGTHDYSDPDDPSFRWDGSLIPSCALLLDGRDYWEDQYSNHARDLCALEATL